MPIHDWTKVTAGTWHAFHLSWISSLQQVLNNGLLPSDYYAQAEQIAGPYGPDVLVLGTNATGNPGGTESSGGIAVKLAPPRTSIIRAAEMDQYARKQRSLAIRHSSDDSIVAFVELVSPGNKNQKRDLVSFVNKAVDLLRQGIHLLVIDLFPPTKRDPEGIHSLIWQEITDTDLTLPKNTPLIQASFAAGFELTAYVEPTAVGLELHPMPLFLETQRYVEVPLEQTYQEAFRGVPQRWKDVLA